ncbi:MAG: 50S ribosomal protein L11 methyltransferase [Ilumatobacteraceae bacterium]
MRALVVTVPSAEAELAADALWALGVAAVEERSIDGSAVELWTSIGEGGGDGAGDARAADMLDSRGWAWRFAEVDESVADSWRSFAQPVEAAPGIVICPAWQVTDLPVGGGEGSGIVIAIEPGASFGLGDHPTTMLSVRALAGYVRRGDDVLDVGCGSGVLSITALRLGAAHARAIDIADAAVEATAHNAVLNGVEVDVSTQSLANVEGVYDVVVANILAPVLVELAADLRRVTGRVLILSGVLDGRFEHVVAALSPMEVVDVEVIDGWASVVLRGCAPSSGEHGEGGVAP